MKLKVLTLLALLVMVLGLAVQSLRRPGLLATLRDSQRRNADFWDRCSEGSNSQATVGSLPLTRTCKL